MSKHSCDPMAKPKKHGTRSWIYKIYATFKNGQQSHNITTGSQISVCEISQDRNQQGNNIQTSKNESNIIPLKICNLIS